MPNVTLVPGRELDDAEVSALPLDRQPQPFEPYRVSHPAPGRGRGLKRRSSRGDRWCPFCQTLLESGLRACPGCKKARDDYMDSHPASNPAPAETVEYGDNDLRSLIGAVEEMSRVIAFASAHQNTRGTLRKSQVEDMFMACKEVIVAAEPIRRELRDECR